MIPENITAPGADVRDFAINAAGPASNAFLATGIHTFQAAMQFVAALPYGRNQDKENLCSIFTEGCGTCSTKHALLWQLAHENNFRGLRLMVGMFRMNGHNTPAVANTLRQYLLPYMPEAHCYLRFEGRIIDCTSARGGILNFEAELLEEEEIQSGQIGDYKVRYHKAYLEEWLNRHPEVHLSPDELWAVREQCIRNLSGE